jgi:formate hydrogenlyase subunit 3/multisubunit Na+/H+ antiporter MnhD subunit
MQNQIQEKKAPWVLYTIIGLAGFSVLALTTIVPLGHWLPITVTESATVVGVTENGCVVEGSYGYPIVVSDCNAKPGETIQVSYNMPAIVQSQYMQRVQERAALIQP